MYVITNQLCWRIGNSLSLHRSPLQKNNQSAVLADRKRASLQLDYQSFLYFEIMLNAALLHIKAAMPPVPPVPTRLAFAAKELACVQWPITAPILNNFGSDFNVNELLIVECFPSIIERVTM
jgi:hypothetical protein